MQSSYLSTETIALKSIAMERAQIHYITAAQSIKMDICAYTYHYVQFQETCHKDNHNICKLYMSHW